MSDDVVSNGKYVALSYTMLDAQGQVVEQHDLPVGYVHGSDTQLIGDMDKAIAGHRAGDEVELMVSAEQAFGHRDETLTFTDDLDNVPSEYHRIGAEVQMQNDLGESRTFYVTRIEHGKLTVDGNHPLAGQDLTIRVKIHEVRDAHPGEAQFSGIHALDMPGPTSSIN
jgi:FKBP-type peptidyl-prolyl cis-trans isomerase SlyD